MEERKVASVALASERWAIVRRSSMRGEAKLAWQFLFGLFGKVETEMWVHSSSIGADQGCGDRNGRRCVLALKTAGWITLLDHDKHRGGYLIRLEDPLKVVIARRMSVENAGGGALFPDEEADANKPKSRPEDEPDTVPFPDGGCGPQTADRVPHPPPVFKPRESIKSKCLNTTQRARIETPNTVLNKGGGSCTTSAASEPDEDSIGSAIADRLTVLAARLESAVSPEQRAGKIDEVSAWLRRAVNDPLTFPSTFIRVATVLVDGVLQEATVTAILGTLNRLRESGTLRTSPGRYFQKAVANAMEAKGIAWGKL